VLERRGDAIRFHPSLLGFAGHYRYEPRPVAVARGNEKGRVERSIGYIRRAFFAARRFADLDDLNAQADDWCRGLAADRRCPGEPDRTVREVFAEEARHLLSLPDDPAPLLERVAVKVGKTPYARFDLNDYSIPHTHVRRTLTVLADIHELRVVDGAQVIALHRRSYDRGAQIEQTEHLQALIDQKQAARQHRATDRLAQVLDRYGAADLQAAIREALDRDVPHPNAVRLALEHRREQRGEAPPIDIDLPADVRARDAPVQPHALETYDELKDLDDE
jgi:hypothetical protein